VSAAKFDRASDESDAARARADAEWDAGDLGCGELVLALRGRLGALAPGQVLKLVALDPGACADIPAWCRLTDHELVLAQHPVYLIRRKEG
jgi:tRNA 2-thiouridine synthesizing protein A